MIEQPQKTKVSYVLVAVYVIFVVGSTLLVGLLPALVNLPTCEDKATEAKSTKIETSNDKPLNDFHSNVLKKVQDKVNAHKQESSPKKTNSKRETLNLVERYHAYKSSNPEKFINPFLSKRTDKMDRVSVCPELSNPQPGVIYPWYNGRLSKDIYPINYDIELFVPKWIANIYDAFVEIEIQLNKPTNVLILHAKMELPLFNDLKDKNGNSIEVSCIGEFQFNDYYIVKLNREIQPSEAPLKLSFFVIGFFEYESGIFEISFTDASKTSKLLASKFEPIDARKGYPCFDEPSFKATYNVKIDHAKNTVALSNMPRINDEPIEGIDDSIQTHFAHTPQMPSYLMAYVVFDNDDFSYVSGRAANNIPVRLWARKPFIDRGYGDAPLNLTIKIFNSLQDIFRNVNSQALPDKIDLFTMPDYPMDAVPHFGLPIFREEKVLFDLYSASERDLQETALLIAKQLAEFWFGNFVTFAWWDELWLQEALGDYIKYRAVDDEYPGWNVLDQFITEELIYALVDDGYPSSHPIYKNINSPYEIEEYFDEVESSKAAAIFRMVEEEKNIYEMYQAITEYLNAHIWGIADIKVFYEKIGKIRNWSAKDFFDRWTIQANYPLLRINIADTSSGQEIRVTQSRALNSNSSIFSGDLLYPSPYGFIWFVPLACSFGTGPGNDEAVYETTFYIDTRDYTSSLRASSNGKKWTWVHCDRKFTGFYETDYSAENWENLGEALKMKNNEFTSEDRANIIHNLFLNAFTERTTYFTLVDVLSYLNRETDYLPWRTVYKHMMDMANILQYKESFIEVSAYFITLMRKIETDLNPWSPSGFHQQELLKETILKLACKLQDPECLKKATETWELAVQIGDLSGAPAYVREVVFNYHFQNTYNIEDWRSTLLSYELNYNLVLQKKLLEALTFTRLPWLLAKLIETEKTDGLNMVDFFITMRWLAESPLGREVAWDELRINFDSIEEFYGEDDPRIGQLLLDICSSFENEFMFYELLEFVFFTQTGSSGNARFKALEIVSTNVGWLMDKEEEIKTAFADGRKSDDGQVELFKNRTLKTADPKNKQDSVKFMDNARKMFQKYFPNKIVA